MAKRSVWMAAAGAISVALMLAACGQGGAQKSAAGPQTIRVDGSSTVFPISEAAAEAFMNEARGQTRVTVGESGTGGGFRKFCDGETEVQDASRPILAEEMAACAAKGVSYVEVPIAFDGLTVVVNPANPVSSITVEELRTIWAPAAEGKVTNWRQVNPSWPDAPLTLFGADTASGTFDYFTEAVVGEAKSSRTDYTPSADDNVTVQGVVTNQSAMGYFGIAYFEQNMTRVKALSIDGGKGAVAPSSEAVASGAYPLSRPIFIYFNADALRRPALQRFAQYYIENAGRFATQVGYVPLPQSAYATFAERVRVRRAGTAFGGRQDVGASIEEVLGRPLVSEAAAQGGE